MTLRALIWAFDQDKLASAHKFVLVVLANIANQDAECFPSQSYIARKSSLSRQRVNLILGELEEFGFINIVAQTRANGSHRSCCYQLNMPDDEGAEASPAKAELGFLYIVESQGRVKIGISRNIESRIRALQTASGTAVSLLKSYRMPMPEARVAERQILEKLKQYRTLGEWFSCDAELLLDEAAKLIEGVVSRNATPQKSALSEGVVSSNATGGVSSEDTPIQDSRYRKDSKQGKTPLFESLTDSKEGTESHSGRRSRRQPMAENWEPDERGILFAKALGFAEAKIRQLVVACRDYHLKHGTLIAGSLGLAATWRTWCNNEVKFSSEREARYGRNEKPDFESRIQGYVDEARRYEDQAGIVRPSDALRGH